MRDLRCRLHSRTGRPWPSAAPRLPSRRRCSTARSCGPRAPRRSRAIVSSGLTIFRKDDLVLEKALGTVGFLDVSSYTPMPGSSDSAGAELDLQLMERRASQDVSQGGVQARLYQGRVKRGPLGGTRIMLKGYPSTSKSPVADAMAANELAAHCGLQSPVVLAESENVSKLLGGFEDSGEQWLVFKNTGIITAAMYAQEAGTASQQGRAVGDRWPVLSRDLALARRHAFIVTILRQAMQGLAFMHSHNRLHQSIGPASVLISRANEADPEALNVRLRDLAFAVDVSPEALFGGATLGEVMSTPLSSGLGCSGAPAEVASHYSDQAHSSRWSHGLLAGLLYACKVWDRGAITTDDPLRALCDNLWRRARQAGAYSELERRSFGIADDVYASGLLLAYMAFVSLADPGSVDGPSIQRLLESTFQLDIPAAREYCEADERWARAVTFLDAGSRAGWNLLENMLCPEWRRRPTAESCLNHPFLSGAAIDLRPS